MLRQDGTQALDVSRVRIFALKVQPRSCRLDVEPLKRCRLAGNGTQLASLPGSLESTLGGAFICFSPLRRAVACRNERSASVAQNECICATPWMKNSWALGFDVVILNRMCSLPCPESSLAGSDGGTLPGGGEQRSTVLDCAKPALASSTQN